MEFTNTQIIIILLLIIVFTFIYNYDVYVVVKNEPICKPVFVTKKTLDSNALNIINKEMTNELKKKVFDTNILEKFINYSPEIYENFTNSDMDCNLAIPNPSLLKLFIPEVSTNYKKIVIENIINVLANIPTNISTDNIKELVEYFAIIYQVSSNINIFFDNVAVSIKINQSPYNSSYAHLILYLIAKFDSIYTSTCMDASCVNNINSRDELNKPVCNVRFLDKESIKQETINPSVSQPSTSQQMSSQPSTSQQMSSQPSTIKQMFSQPSTSQQMSSQPSTSQQMSSQPSTIKQMSSQPSTRQQMFSEQMSSQPSTRQQMFSEQMSSQPSTSQQMSIQPSTSQQMSIQPSTSQQMSIQPSTSQQTFSQQLSTLPTSKQMSNELSKDFGNIFSKFTNILKPNLTENFENVDSFNNNFTSFAAF
jgi:hypothetical protein